MTNNPKPDNGTEFKVKITKTRWQGSSLRARNTCSGKESLATLGKGPMHPCERCKEARPNGARQAQSLESTTDPGKVQRSMAKSVQGRRRGDVSKKQQGVKVDCCNIMVKQRRKERKSGRPFEVWKTI